MEISIKSMKNLDYIEPNYSQLRKVFIVFIKWYTIQKVKILDEIRQLHGIYQQKDGITIDDFFRMKNLNSSVTFHNEKWLLYIKTASIFIDRYLMKIIINYLPTETVFKFKKPHSTNYSDIIISIDFPLKRSGCSIIKDNTWNEIKKNIDLKSQGINSLNNECTLCFEKTVFLVSCNKCANINCCACYIDIIRTNRGLHKCPFCRHEFGKRFHNDKLFKVFMKKLEKNVLQSLTEI
jgi:hypothetical protein